MTAELLYEVAAAVAVAMMTVGDFIVIAQTKGQPAIWTAAEDAADDYKAATYNTTLLFFPPRIPPY